MEWLKLLLGFFVANVLGYGGGPSSIPLMYQEIVVHYRWNNDAQFSNVLALGNALPGPIATKIAASVGYNVGGWAGMIAALVATVLPSALALIGLLKLLDRYRKSQAVKGMTLLVQPVITILMVVLTWQLSKSSISSLGIWQSVLIAAVAFWAMQIRKIHPALVIVGAFIYGGVVIPHLSF
jgi:chromate transporter